jgi:putative sterol carrier protein
MGYPFPSEAWLTALKDVLNTDTRYADVAKNWEGDLAFVVEADEPGKPNLPFLYLDLWHGKCRSVRVYEPDETELPKAKFLLKAPLRNLRKILAGELDPMQAMMTRRLIVDGNMAYMLRNVPTVLDFVRCARLVEISS